MPPILSAAHLDTPRSPDAPRAAPRTTQKGCVACSCSAGSWSGWPGSASPRGGWWSTAGAWWPGLSSVLFAVACLVVSRDDGGGRFCPECVARNPEDAEICENCGHALG